MKIHFYIRFLNFTNNSRETGRNATVIIDMNGQTTSITDPNNKGDAKKFTFDYSYWSHDGCKMDNNGYFVPDTSHPNGKKFADQVISKFLCCIISITLKVNIYYLCILFFKIILRI